MTDRLPKERLEDTECPSSDDSMVLSTDRDRLISAIYDAAIEPAAYGSFVKALSEYLEHAAFKAWKLREFSEVDISRIAADRGLAMHLANLNARLSTSPHRVPPGSLRERNASLPGPAAMIDSRGRVTSLSHGARALLGTIDPKTEDFAAWVHGDDSRRLRDAIKDHVIHQRTVPPSILRGDACHVIVRTLRCDADQEHYLCIETLGVNWSPDLEVVLHSSFELTPAELRVIRMLVAGQSVKEISRGLARSEGTIRNQIKSALAKTDAGGVANLNRVVALIAENIAGAPSLSTLHATSSVRLDILALPDGRALEVRHQGPEDGRPALFIHGMLFGSELPPAALKYLEKNGLRLIAPARPNFGMSDPPPGAPEDEPDRFVEDLIFVLDHYGVDRTACLTNIAGSVYGYAFASSFPERVTGLVNAASNIPLLKARQFVSMPPTQRLIAFLMRFVPEYLPPLLQSGIAQIRASEEIPFLRTLYKEGTCDLAVATRPDLADLMARSVHFCTDQGYLGAYTDTLQAVRDWSAYARGVSSAGVPSIHVHGRADPQYMVEDVAAFVDRFDTLQLRVVEDAGQLVLFDRPDVVIDALADLMT